MVKRAIEADVVIAGGGPVGLCAGALLMENGITSVVLEAQSELGTDPRKRVGGAVAGTGNWRASTFQAPTLELLEDIAVSEEMLRRGLIAERFQYRDRRGGVIAEFDMGLLKEDTRYPFRLQLNQQALVFMLAERMSRSKYGSLQLDATVRDVQQTDGAVEVGADTSNGTIVARGQYLLAADGGNSTVRHLLGIDFEGMTYPEDHLMVSTPFAFDEVLPGLAYVNFVSDPVEPLFILRTEECWRVDFHCRNREFTLSEPLPREFVEEKLQTVFRREERYEVWDSRIFHVHQRLAETFRVNRVVLLGDAAHVNHPAGGLGLNCGIHDAFDVSRRLVRILKEGSDADSELEAYATRRRAVAKDYVAVYAHENSQITRQEDEEVRTEKHRVIAEIAADPVRAREWLLRSSMLTAVAAEKIGAPV